jgi:hypothetical protein
MSRQNTKRAGLRSELGPADALYRRARKANEATEDEALNALCDARLKEPRRPLREILKKLGHGLEE